MHGNVTEWCFDYWGIPKNKENKNKNYNFMIPYVPHAYDYINKKESPFKVAKGGDWISSGAACRSAFRWKQSIGHRSSGVGFRVVLEVKSKKK